jgi:hypothetical protein
MYPDSPSWIRKVVSAAQTRARRKGLPFSITVEDMQAQWDEQDGHCYWFHVPLGAPEHRPYHPLTPSLDRVRGDLGYTYGNVVWTCLAANTAKRDTDPDSWEEFLDVMGVCFRREND